jgi:nicotinamide-nucleotide amidase
MTPDTLVQAERLLAACRARGLMLATAESCTGGLIAAYLTAIAGSSDVVERGFVTYSNEAKSDLLGVPPSVIVADGAVSEEVARLMARGARLRSGADLAVAVTGVAGPGGGSAEKPVGLVHIAADGGERQLHRACRFGDIGRQQVREATVTAAFDLIEELVEEPVGGR